MTAYGTALYAGYNGDGLRSWKDNDSNAANGRTYFLYDGWAVQVTLFPVISTMPMVTNCPGRTRRTQGVLTCSRKPWECGSSPLEL